MRLLLLACLFAAPASAAELTLASAKLSSSGVAQYDYAADMDGPGTLLLDVPLSDVDDVLKSLRVSDPAGPSSVRMPGLEPLTETSRTLPFPREALTSSDAMLSALVGAEIRLPLRDVAGRIMGVATETKTLPDNGGTVVRHRLTIATAKGIESVVLEDEASVELPSDTLRAQVAAALSAVAAHSAQDRRQVEIVLTGAGRRRVTVSDVLSAPVWKASYRIGLGAEAGHVHLDGEAVVENLTGRDWTNLDVTLTSGQPVLYRQNLYQSLFAGRPEAPVDVPARVAPRMDQGAIAMAAPPPAPPPAPASAPAMRQRFVAGGDAAKSVADEALALPSKAEQTATQVNADKEKARLLIQVRDEIHSHWNSAKHSFVAIGKALLLLERTLSHEEFKRLTKGTDRLFPFTETIGIQLRQVAKAVTAGTIDENEMPGSYSVAYQIAVMDGPTLEIARARNILRPDVTRTEIIAFRREISTANTTHEEGVNLSAVRRKKARLTKLRDDLMDRLAAVNAELQRLDKVTT